jgi:hypothetical protein
MELYLHSSHTPAWRGVRLKNHRDNFTLFYPSLCVLSYNTYTIARYLIILSCIIIIIIIIIINLRRSQ